MTRLKDAKRGSHSPGGVMKKHHPIKNLGNFAHPPKAQTNAGTPKLIGKSATGKKRKA